MLEKPNPYNPKYRIQSHGYEAYAVDLRACGEAQESRVTELEAALTKAADNLHEASEGIADWSAYASDYFQEKHELSAEVAETKVKALLHRQTANLNPRLPKRCP